MPAKDLRSAISKNRIDTSASLTPQTLGVVGQSDRLREELEKAAEPVTVQEMPIAQLSDNPFQYLARSEQDQSMGDESLRELSASIQQNGFYGALLARRKPGAERKPGEPQYELAYGHRRKAAARLAGLTALPVKVVELSDNQMARIMASENFSREDLTPLGEANVLGILYTTQNLSIDKITEVVGKTRHWVQLRIELYQASDDIKAMVEQKPSTLSYVPILRQVKDSDQRTRLIKAVLEDGLTREQLRQEVELLTPQAKTKRSVKNVTNITQGYKSDILHNLAEETEASSEEGTPSQEIQQTLRPDNGVKNIIVADNNSASSPKAAVRGQFNSSFEPITADVTQLSKNRASLTDYYHMALEELELVVTKLENIAEASGHEVNEADSAQLESLVQRLQTLLAPKIGY
ncbi:MAG TPA: ParB/RepB/Spo0J family partition protein [Chloroflexia bacterium]|nr:ParB/RepB/Spo0J family partition protein [Chloroflexia bacterium]